MLRSLGNIFRLGVKELRSLRADIVLAFLIVYAFTAAIYTVATGVKFEVQDAAVAVVDNDRSELSRSIRHALLPPYFKPAEDIAADQVDRALDTGRYVFVIEIPPDFEADVLAGRRPSVLVNVDATAMSQAGNGAGYIQSIIAQEVLAYVGRAEGSVEAPVNLVVRARFNPNLDSGWFTPVMEVINNITMLSLILASASTARSSICWSCRSRRPRSCWRRSGPTASSSWSRPRSRSGWSSSACSACRSSARCRCFSWARSSISSR